MSELEEFGDEETPLTRDLRETSVAVQALLAVSVSALAVQLAQQAGEATPRPLSETQIDRAWQVLRAERNTLARLMCRDLGWSTN